MVAIRASTRRKKARLQRRARNLFNLAIILADGDGREGSVYARPPPVRRTRPRSHHFRLVVTDPQVRMSLRLQAAFGLRREESIKFQPRYADRGDHIAIKGSWAKGGRDRTVPITTPEQRAVLDEVHRLAGLGSLIPANKTYIQQRHVYDGQCKAAGLSNMHGLRHRYAQMRYEILTGWKSPAAGGPSAAQLNLSRRLADQQVRQRISRELGHERVKVTAVYLGS
ncbi:integrase [Candidimonas nitroreducens]|uniref:Integrase n=1 Tax=Candidimonas nitroreducens TaxID=683354 RepID=A0A225MAZ6_9BURK|nr:integrase domain-containing protein [Candidimonas nitroreducens]OWT58386.1 integrase [Candidimonas nitroreducens]